MKANISTDRRGEVTCALIPSSLANPASWEVMPMDSSLVLTRKGAASVGAHC